MDKQTQVVYVVLHYKTADETEKCVSKLLKLRSRKIVVVCNGSQNGSDDCIEQKYADEPEVVVLVNSENLGFANGLNTGIRYAKEVLKAECIVCINNDVYIDQEDFTEELLRQYEQQSFAVAAPDVINLDGIHCNPGYMEIPTEAQLCQELRYYRSRLKCCTVLFGIPEMGMRALERLRRKFCPGKPANGPLPLFHGCCWIFSKRYLQRFDGICPKTYLYGEEPILSYLCYRNGLDMVYLPTLTVTHGESIATKQELQGFAKRKEFYYTHLIHSTQVLLELVRSGKDGTPV